MTFKHQFLSTSHAVARRPVVASPDEAVRRTVELAQIDTGQLGAGLRCAAATLAGWERGALEGGGA